MGQLISILLALASLAFDDFGVSAGWQVPLAVPSLIALPYALAALQHRAGLRGNFRRAALLGRLAALSPVLAQYLAVGVFGWLRSVESWLDVRLSLLQWPHLGLLLALAPFVVYSIAAIDAEARLNSEHGVIRRSLRRFQLRMFVAGLAPITGYLAVAALFGRSESLRIHVEETALFGAAFSGVTLLVFIFLLPLLMRYTWDTEALSPGPQRSLLENIAKLASFRCKEIAVWRTGGLIANAAIVGVTPGTRRVFFSDALLSRLGPRELAAVFAHEMGHARRHHVPLFIAWAVAFFAGLDALVLELDPEGGALGGGLLAAGLALWLVGFGWLSRRVELEADLFALELLGEGHGLASALDAVSPVGPQKSGWRHFSMQKRVAFLDAANRDAGVAKRLRRKLGAARWLGGAALVAALALQFVNFTESYAEDQARAYLRMGLYESASESLARAQNPTEDIVEITGLAHAAFERDFPTREAAGAACSERAASLDPDRDADLIETWEFLANLTSDDDRREVTSTEP